MPEPVPARRPLRLEMSPQQLGYLFVGTIVSLAAGAPLAIAASGRTLALGPADALILLLVVTLPLWFRRLPPPGVFVVFGTLFVLWVWSSAVFWSIDYRRSVLTAKAMLEAAVVFLAAWHVARGGQTRMFPLAIRSLNAVLAIQIVWAIWRGLTGPAQGFYALKNEVILPLGGNNFLAIFLEFGLLYELLSRRRWWLPCAALNATGIILTLSRGALLSSGIMLTLMSVVVLGVRGQRKFSLIGIGTLTAAGAVLAMTPALRILVTSFNIVNRTAGSRLELWQDAWQAAAWRPMTGVGYGAYESIGAQRDVHSLPLALLGETGTIGLALFSLAVLSVLIRVVAAAADRRTGPRRPEALGVAAGLGVVLLHSLIEPFFLGFSLVWAAAVFAWIQGPWGPRRDVVESALPVLVGPAPD